VSLERDLVAECQTVAVAMNAFLAVVGQRNARKSGSTLGFPDLVLICGGRTVLIEMKQPKTGRLSVGQQAFIQRAAEQGVRVFVVDCVEDFVQVVNSCRRRARAEA